ncbi:MAG: PHP domain-containing protein [Oscillospiraceae bacterium]|nr:PHP domain-containing protein [Oscillospiraceae bacterium]
MIQDLHSHTYYSFCGRVEPTVVVDAAIAGGIAQLGFTDHNYGVGIADINTFNEGHIQSYGGALKRYFDHITAVKQLYKGRIEILRGIEICTLALGNYALPQNEDISFFDYCIIENLGDPRSVMAGDVFAFAKRCGCKAGIAHTDLFAFIEANGLDAKDYFSQMAEQGIFWEMNVNCDSTHGYREHTYVEHFFADKRQQEIVLNAGVEVGVGFDGHKAEDYRGDRITYYCRKLEQLGIKQPFASK